MVHFCLKNYRAKFDCVSGIVDSLDIDWASLCTMSKPKVAATTTSALKRFTGASIFERIGLSKAFAGDALFKKIQNKCREQLDADKGKSFSGH